ncbi:MAG: glutamine synthetase [Clostridiales bacterium]|nr:glutamine synthetase [Clostridiales bacterium]
MLAQEVMNFLEENDVKFVRLAFPDLFGKLKNIAIQPDLLEEAFEQGIPFEAAAVDGFASPEDGSLLLRPDPDTLCILPWRPQAGRVCRLLCDVVTADGKPYQNDTRGILRKAEKLANERGFSIRLGAECEFYLFEADEQGRITKNPQDRGRYLDVAPLDRGEDVRREICLTLLSMNIRPELSHHERGPGQNEIDFHRADPVTGADHLVAFHNAVRTIAARYGLCASFMPKPLANEFGNAFKVNFALFRDRKNLFRIEDGHMTPEAQAAMAGVLNRLEYMTLFLNPIPNSYDRLTDGETPNRICWSHQRRLNAVRVPLPQHRFARMQVASADNRSNAYLAYALLIFAALEGIERGEKLPQAAAGDGGSMKKLPESLSMAIASAKDSDFIRRALPESVLNAFLSNAEDMVKQDYQNKDRLFQEQFECF